MGPERVKAKKRKTDEPVPVKCRCARKPRMESNHLATGFRIVCMRGHCQPKPKEVYPCWIGPTRKTTRGAVNAWNRVMGGTA